MQCHCILRRVLIKALIMQILCGSVASRIRIRIYASHGCAPIIIRTYVRKRVPACARGGVGEFDLGLSCSIGRTPNCKMCYVLNTRPLEQTMRMCITQLSLLLLFAGEQTLCVIIHKLGSLIAII